jgi:hypothetical protein
MFTQCGGEIPATPVELLGTWEQRFYAIGVITGRNLMLAYIVGMRTGRDSGTLDGS